MWCLRYVSTLIFACFPFSLALYLEYVLKRKAYEFVLSRPACVFFVWVCFFRLFCLSVWLYLCLSFSSSIDWQVLGKRIAHYTHRTLTSWYTQPTSRDFCLSHYLAQVSISMRAHKKHASFVNDTAIRLLTSFWALGSALSYTYSVSHEHEYLHHTVCQLMCNLHTRKAMESYERRNNKPPL